MAKEYEKEILLLIISVAAAGVLFTFRNINFMAKADEGYYLNYAAYIGTKGVLGIPDLFRYYLANHASWIFPNPLRIGFIMFSACWLNLFGSSFMNLAFLSLFSYCLLLAVSFYFAGRYFGNRIASLFTLLLAFSPLYMAMARRALMETTVSLFTILTVWLFLEILRKGSKYKILLFVIIYAFTILIKENVCLLSIFFLFYLLVRRRIFGGGINLSSVLAVTLYPFLIAGIVYVIAAGGIAPVIITAKIILNSPSTNLYAIYFGSGPWYSCLVDFLLLSPWVCILAIVYSFGYLVKDRWQEEVVYFALLSAGLIFLSVFFTKNIRYLITLDVPIRLFAVLMLDELARRFFKKRVFLVLSIAVIAICLFDYLSFYNLFVLQGIYDPVSARLLEARHIIPYR